MIARAILIAALLQGVSVREWGVQQAFELNV